ncbi:MAG: hypothetical protein AAF743_03140 [Planctomycetota bacterium]
MRRVVAIFCLVLWLMPAATFANDVSEDPPPVEPPSCCQTPEPPVEPEPVERAPVERGCPCGSAGECCGKCQKCPVPSMSAILPAGVVCELDVPDADWRSGPDERPTLGFVGRLSRPPKPFS